MKSYPAIGIRPIVDSRRLGIRDALEGKVREMAEAAKVLIEQNVFYADGTPAKVVIFSGSIAGGEEAARCEQEFAAQHVTATLSVTPSWCYPLETIDLNPMTVKAIWGFNGTERPGAVYLASALAAHNQMKRPCFRFTDGMCRTWKKRKFRRMLQRRSCGLHAVRWPSDRCRIRHMSDLARYPWVLWDRFLIRPSIFSILACGRSGSI